MGRSLVARVFSFLSFVLPVQSGLQSQFSSCLRSNQHLWSQVTRGLLLSSISILESHFSQLLSSVASVQSFFELRDLSAVLPIQPKDVADVSGIQSYESKDVANVSCIQSYEPWIFSLFTKLFGICGWQHFACLQPNFPQGAVLSIIVSFCQSALAYVQSAMESSK
jgi:hypothetical protein